MNIDPTPRQQRTHNVFQEANWVPTSSGLILPAPPADEPAEAPPATQWHTAPSGLILPTSSEAHTRTRKPTCISLFTGAGGFDLGFHSAGWRIVTASDYDTSAAWTYCYNMGSRPIQMHFITPQDRERFLKDVVRRSQKKPKNGEHWELLVELDELDRAYFHRHDDGPVEIEDATPNFFLGDVRKLTGSIVTLGIIWPKGR